MKNTYLKEEQFMLIHGCKGLATVGWLLCVWGYSEAKIMTERHGAWLCTEAEKGGKETRTTALFSEAHPALKAQVLQLDPTHSIVAE